ncbi:glycosyltransferase family 4 protein [Candidatus Pacearchaeota archaeon]|nr:glycosyltransferase family 4 protein [Candidatus Pacearchaeota archaeon]
MKLTIVTFFYSPAGGGVPRYTQELGRQFIAMGHEVDIITYSESDFFAEKEGSLCVYRVPSFNIFQKEEENQKKAKEFLKFLQGYLKKGTDVIVAQDLHVTPKGFGHLFSLNMAALEKGIPLVLTSHSFISEHDIYKHTKLFMIKSLLWDRIISVSAALAEFLFKEGVGIDKISMVIPPVDTEKFRPDLGKEWLRSRIDISDGDFLIAHASRIDTIPVAEEKGVFTLLNALALIKEKNVKVIFAAAPTAPFAEPEKKATIEHILQTAKLLGIGKRVIVRTFNPDEMPLLYNGADLFVMASRMESYGMVYAEAIASGLPAIGTTVGGVPEVIENGKSGELIPPDNPVELAKTIENLVRNPELLRNMASYGREMIIQRQNIDKIARKLLGVYESTIQKKAQS